MSRRATSRLTRWTRRKLKRISEAKEVNRVSRKKPHLVVARLGAIAVATALVACPAKEDPSKASMNAAASVNVEARVDPSRRAYHTKKVEGGKAVLVRVAFASRRPVPSWPIPHMVQSQCGGSDHVTDEALSASADLGANGAVVWLDDIHEGNSLPASAASQDEKRCVFTPHVLALPASGTLKLSNGDPANHAVRFDFEGDDALGFMKTLPGGGSVGVPISEDWAGHVAKITCPIHLWMWSYALFFGHPYFAVTEGGNARIEGVPAGTYHVTVWYEGTTSTYDSSVKLSAPQTARAEVNVGEGEAKVEFRIADDGRITSGR
jgi:hypothetical protein